MTRTDLLLLVGRIVDTGSLDECRNLINILHEKVEIAYVFSFELDNQSSFKGIGEILRKYMDNR